tara:strand:+ start:11370 stop:11678 length:309 start_codon:yes stop_codon:yes gene_type:complete
MEDKIFLILGYIGSFNACLMMLPQLYLTIKKKSFEDLSMNMIFMNLLTQICFLPYTIHFRLYPLITVNSVLLSSDLIIIYYYYFNNQTSDPLFLKDSLVENE